MSSEARSYEDTTVPPAAVSGWVTACYGAGSPHGAPLCLVVVGGVVAVGGALGRVAELLEFVRLVANVT